MKIILALPIIIGAFILTGCKSPSEVRQSGPEEIFHSNKNVNDVSECILPPVMIILRLNESII